MATTAPDVMNSSRLPKERLAVVLGVVLLGQRPLDLPEFQRDEGQALALDPGDDLAA